MIRTTGQCADNVNSDDLRKMTTQGEETAADEALDPSQMYSGISMANDRINALQTESPKIK